MLHILRVNAAVIFITLLLCLLNYDLLHLLQKKPSVF